LGVTVSSEVANDGCSTVRAQVAVDTTGGIAVAVRGASRGSEGRIVSDAALAAAWIDSWTREDVDLWAAPPPRVASVQPSTHPIVPPSDVAPAVGAAAPTSSRWDRFAVSASYAQTWSDDDATWKGLDVAACVRVVGGFCVGGSVRVAFDEERLVHATGVARSDLSLLALARYPVAIGRMSIAPELALASDDSQRAARKYVQAGDDAAAELQSDGSDVRAETSMCEPNEPGMTMAPKYTSATALGRPTRRGSRSRCASPCRCSSTSGSTAGPATPTPFAHGSVFERRPTPASHPSSSRCRAAKQRLRDRHRSARGVEVKLLSRARRADRRCTRADDEGGWVVPSAVSTSASPISPNLRRGAPRRMRCW
jgi:hypothetical protein